MLVAHIFHLYTLGESLKYFLNISNQTTCSIVPFNSWTTRLSLRYTMTYISFFVCHSILTFCVLLLGFNNSQKKVFDETFCCFFKFCVSFFVVGRNTLYNQFSSVSRESKAGWVVCTPASMMSWLLVCPLQSRLCMTIHMYKYQEWEEECDMTWKRKFAKFSSNAFKK